jgi:rod shape-determining protein MreD
LLVAAWLSVLPLPNHWLWLRPIWIVLVLVYWVVALPAQVGVGVAWLVGLLMDGVSDGVLGQQALSLALIAYICQVSYQRLRMFSMLQQVLVMLVLAGLHQLVYHWLHNMRGTAADGMWYLLPAVMTALCWPGVRVLLRRMQLALMPAQRM